LTNRAFKSNLAPPLDRNPPTERLGIVGKTETVERPEKMESSEAVVRPKKIERSEAAEKLAKNKRSETVVRLKKMEGSEAVARPEKVRRSEAAERLAKNKISEAVARLETEKLRIYRKADPPEGEEGGRKRTASRWYRTRHPDRVLPKEAVVP